MPTGEMLVCQKLFDGHRVTFVFVRYPSNLSVVKTGMGCVAAAV